MILQALYEYYQRKAADPGSTICSPWIRMERNTLSYSDR